MFISSIEGWVQKNRDFDIRIYRTFGGLRCLVTNRTFDPTQEGIREILQNLKCDPMYIKLCQNQECFRARLTPKPWQCGADKPPSRYPWDNSEDELKYRRWEERYKRAASRYAVCKLVKQIGYRKIHPDVSLILSVHDGISCSENNLKLA